VPDQRLDMRGSGTPVRARLRPGVALEDAARQLTAAMAPIEVNGNPSAARAMVTSMYEDQTSGYGRTMRTLIWAVTLVVFIACVNVAGLLLARGAARRQELAVRASIGAGRGRLARQPLVESLALAFAGAAVGIGLAYASLDSLVALIPLSLPANTPVAIDGTVLVFTLALTIVTALAFGLVPAVKLSRARNLHTTLAGGDRDAATPLSRRSGQWLIGTEIALALVLVSASGLMVRSFSKLLDVDLGYDPSAVLTFEVEPIDQSATERNQFYPALQTALLRLPGVTAVGAIDQGTLMGGSTYRFMKSDIGADIGGPSHIVLPGYFEAMGVRPLMGRLLEDTDRAPGEAALVNATANAKYFRGAAVGHTLETNGPTRRRFRIVGVVPDLKHGGPQDRSQPRTYILPDTRSKDVTAAFLTTLAIVMRVEGSDGAIAPRSSEADCRVRRSARSRGTGAASNGIRGSTY
jgi:putative ABC transport system permease protein